MPESRPPTRGRRLRRVLRFAARRPRLTIGLLVGSVAIVVLAPLLGVVGGLFDLLVRVGEPLVTTATGRLALVNLALLGLALWGLGELRSRWAAVRTALRTRRHLDGIRLLLAGDATAADAAFVRVIASSARPPRAWPCLADDARLKRARIALDRGRPDVALRQLIEIDVEQLPPPLRRATTRLRIAAERALGEVLPAAVERSLRDALEAAPGDAALLAELAGLLRDAGRHADAAAVQERLLDALPPARRGPARARLVEDLLAAAEAGPDAASGADQTARLHAALDQAERLAPADPRPHLLRARALERHGDPAAAARAFAASRSSRGLDEVVRLLDAWPGLLTPREILETCPLQGAVLLAGREYARRGELDAARRAAAVAARHLDPSPRVATMLAEILERCGETDALRDLRTAAARDLARLDTLRQPLRPPRTAW